MCLAQRHEVARPNWAFVLTAAFLRMPFFWMEKLNELDEGHFCIGLIEFVNLQLSYADKRPGESYEMLDGKKSFEVQKGSLLCHIICMPRSLP